MDNQEIGKNIVQLRKKHGLSQRELAERAGIT
ncbi:helix-turn-helix domain-containing protein, partial [Vibrio sp. V42_P2S4T144]|nr:helix-turn-helix domain-containing protein [Vibrio sp. V42_P2S4T144]